MKSNGHGSFEQKIVLRVNADFADRVLDTLNAEIIDKGDGFVDLVWKRRSIARGDDESIVFEADMLMGVSSGSWQILWEESDY